ncbi:MAG: PilZ domain-containing protein [Candidatus Omnitrophota bacterium]|jgi:c-di-GMP-binding flagellar brake protein YcgR
MNALEERRQFPRVKVSFPVECKTLPSRKYFYTVSKDVSMIGMKILINGFIPRDRLLRLDLNLIDKVLELKAKIVWCNRERMSDKYSAGLQFVELGQDCHKTLTQFLSNVCLA